MLLLPAVAGAQQPEHGRVFLAFDGLFQAGGDATINQSASLTVYGESGTTSASQDIGTAAGLVDFGGGFRVKNFGAGVMFSALTNTTTATISGSIPHPFLVDRPRVVTGTQTGMEHQERVVHLDAYYFVPIDDNLDLGFFLGPSFYKVKQDYVTGLGAFQESSNFETVTLPVGRATASDSAAGFNIGAEATYAITRNVAAAALLRFSRATAELDLGGDTLTMNVGDFQIGGGIRLRF
jgi:hypothetical protein